MSRTSLCMVIAAMLVAVTLSLMVTRFCVLGSAVKLPGPSTAVPVPSSALHRVFQTFSIQALPPAEQGMVRWLLLLPLAALIVCIFRNLIGLPSFGTFTPALLGLAFREMGDLTGIGVIVALVLFGWGMRRLLDRFHLLQIPRLAVLLSLVIVLLLMTILTSNAIGIAATRLLTLFPLVILTGMIERFWTQEEEAGLWSSSGMLLATLCIAGIIALLLGRRAVCDHMMRYPETLGLIMAAQLLLGRYTGFRLSELYRFRDFARDEAVLPADPMTVLSGRLRLDKGHEAHSERSSLGRF